MAALVAPQTRPTAIIFSTPAPIALPLLRHHRSPVLPFCPHAHTSRKAAAATAMAAEEEEKTLVEILDPSPSPLDPTRYVSFVRDPSCGAVATFEGTTRDTFEGRRVVELRYEGYPPMALRQIREICAAARARWAVERVAVAHRLGRVPVGEASVFAAVSSVHRADALAACGFLIDEVKASVPIWKKEVYEDGEVWKENREFLERRRRGGQEAPAPEKEAGKSGCCGGKVRVEGEAAHVSFEVGEKRTISIAVDSRHVEDVL